MITKSLYETDRLHREDNSSVANCDRLLHLVIPSGRRERVGIASGDYTIVRGTYANHTYLGRLSNLLIVSQTHQCAERFFGVIPVPLPK